jgi:hypothetical protein
MLARPKWAGFAHSNDIIRMTSHDSYNSALPRRTTELSFGVRIDARVSVGWSVLTGGLA